MEKPIKVAQVIGIANNGGVEAVVMNYYRNIDRSKVQFDFLVESESKIINKEEIESMGGRVIIIPPYTKVFEYTRALKKIFEENNYDIVHSNMNTLSVFALRAAKKAKSKVRIAHSHTTSNKKEWKRHLLKSILKRFSKVYSTHYFACSECAGRYQFGDKTYNNGEVVIIKNAIDIERFKFDSEKRKQVRDELGLNDEFLIGYVGRLINLKNQMFLIDVFSEFVKVRNNARLVFVGEGPMEQELKEKVLEQGLSDKVIFYGTTGDVEKMYSAMDLFAFPSLYEGFGLVALEAQVSGLPTIASEFVPNDACVTSRATRLPLNKDLWVKELLNVKVNENRSNLEESVENYRISNLANEL